jgi:hypothetical protein
LVADVGLSGGMIYSVTWVGGGGGILFNLGFKSLNLNFLKVFRP